MDNVIKVNRSAGYEHIIERILQFLSSHDIEIDDITPILDSLVYLSSNPIRACVTTKDKVNKDATIFIQHSIRRGEDCKTITIDGKCSSWLAKYSSEVDGKGMIHKKISTLIDSLSSQKSAYTCDVVDMQLKRNAETLRDRERISGINRASCLWYNNYIDGCESTHPDEFAKARSKPEETPFLYELPEPKFRRIDDLVETKEGFARNKLVTKTHSFPCTGEELYLRKKGIELDPSFTIRRLEAFEGYERIAIPMYLHGSLRSLVEVRANTHTGEIIKRNIGSVKDCYSPIGHLVDTRSEETFPIIVCEGFASAWAANVSTGILAISTAGAQNAPEGLRGYLVSHEKRVHTVFLMLDGDEAGRAASSRCQAMMADKFPLVKVVPISVGCDKGCCPKGVDVWDLLANHGAPHVSSLVNVPALAKAPVIASPPPPAPASTEDEDILALWRKPFDWGSYEF